MYLVIFVCELECEALQKFKGKVVPARVCRHHLTGHISGVFSSGRKDGRAESIWSDLQLE